MVFPPPPHPWGQTVIEVDPRSLVGVMPVCQHGLSLAVSSFRQLRYSKFDPPLAPQSSALVCVRRHCSSRPHFSIRGADGKPHLPGGEARQHGHSSRRGGRLAVGLRHQILRITCNSKSRSLARLAQSVERKALNLVVGVRAPRWVFRCSVVFVFLVGAPFLRSATF